MDETQQQYIERIARMAQMPTKASEIFTTEDQMVATIAIAMFTSSENSGAMVREVLESRDVGRIERMFDDMLEAAKHHSTRMLKELSS